MIIKPKKMSDENENKLDLEMFYNNTESTFEFFRKKVSLNKMPTSSSTNVLNKFFFLKNLRLRKRLIPNVGRLSLVIRFTVRLL